MTSVCAGATQSLGNPGPSTAQHPSQCLVHNKHSTNISETDGWLSEEVPSILGHRLLYICETYQSEENEVPSLMPKGKDKVFAHALAPKGYPRHLPSPPPMKHNIWNLGHGFKESLKFLICGLVNGSIDISS